MSYCRKEGKDIIMFVTREDHEQPTTADIGISIDDLDDEPGLILPNGEINWSCPCLGGMATGPCGVPFREAFSCFHYSKEEIKGSDCTEQFRKMHECMMKYPELYKDYSKEDDDDDDDDDEYEDGNKINEQTGDSEKTEKSSQESKESTQSPGKES